MIYPSSMREPVKQASRSTTLPGVAQAASQKEPATRELTEFAATWGLWSSRRIRAAVLAQQAAKSQPR